MPEEEGGSQDLEPEATQEDEPSEQLTYPHSPPQVSQDDSSQVVPETSLQENINPEESYVNDDPDANDMVKEGAVPPPPQGDIVTENSSYHLEKLGEDASAVMEAQNAVDISIQGAPTENEGEGAQVDQSTVTDAQDNEGNDGAPGGEQEAKEPKPKKKKPKPKPKPVKVEANDSPNLDDFDEDGNSLPILKSPHSIQACISKGIDPKELIRKPLEYFENSGEIPKKFASIACENYEKTRVQKVNMCREERIRVKEEKDYVQLQRTMKESLLKGLDNRESQILEKVESRIKFRKEYEKRKGQHLKQTYAQIHKHISDQESKYAEELDEEMESLRNIQLSQEKSKAKTHAIMKEFERKHRELERLAEKKEAELDIMIEERKKKKEEMLKEQQEQARMRAEKSFEAQYELAKLEFQAQLENTKLLKEQLKRVEESAAKRKAEREERNRQKAKGEIDVRKSKEKALDQEIKRMHEKIAHQEAHQQELERQWEQRKQDRAKRLEEKAKKVKDTIDLVKKQLKDKKKDIMKKQKEAEQRSKQAMKRRDEELERRKFQAQLKFKNQLEKKNACEKARMAYEEKVRRNLEAKMDLADSFKKRREEANHRAMEAHIRESQMKTPIEEIMPGPAQYLVKDDWKLPTKPRSWSMGCADRKFVLSGRSTSPGPGRHTIGSGISPPLNATVVGSRGMEFRKAPAFSMGKPKDKSRKDDFETHEPGPGHYMGPSSILTDLRGGKLARGKRDDSNQFKNPADFRLLKSGIGDPSLKRNRVPGNRAREFKRSPSVSFSSASRFGKGSDDELHGTPGPGAYRPKTAFVAYRRSPAQMNKTIG